LRRARELTTRFHALTHQLQVLQRTSAADGNDDVVLPTSSSSIPTNDTDDDEHTETKTPSSNNDSNDATTPTTTATKKKKRSRAKSIVGVASGGMNATELALLTPTQRAAKVAELSTELASMGGRQAYQAASMVATKRFRASKWLFQLVTKYGLRPKSGESPLMTLEIGAINRQLLVCPWLRVRAIDLLSNDPQIEQCDFFTITPAEDLPSSTSTSTSSPPLGPYSLIMCSMVINAVGSALERGRMLQLMCRHLQPGGHLFLTLPLLCLNHSSTMTYQLFSDALRYAGFIIRETKDTPKIAFFCCQRPLHADNDGRLPAPHQVPHSLTYPPRVVRKNLKAPRDFSVCFASQS
jgi:hypothetical protein